ncbi:MAG: PEP/pyruvate-binding domain-containing protein [Chloroflexota bacterium]
MTHPWILPLNTTEATLSLVGGKGMNLARLAQAKLPVPGGFLITTQAYDDFVTANQLAALLAQTLSGLATDDPAALQTAAEAIRAAFAAGTLSPELRAAISKAYRALAENGVEPIPVAVRSSATAEDLPDMSFAGQQDTFLHVMGDEGVVTAVIDCWSSLWTARAIGYRARNGIAHEDVSLAVVVQCMVPSEASGVLFTANPLNGKRSEMVIDAIFGLGEALVSGQVEPDQYVFDVSASRIVSKKLGAKALAIHGQAGGGTTTVSAAAAAQQAISDAIIWELIQQGQRVQDLFGFPQDIEWGWANGRLYLLQSRPITSLFPLPPLPADDMLHLMFSFASVQGMLDPMTPLGRDAIMAAFAGAATQLFQMPRTLANQQVLRVAGSASGLILRR